MPKIATLGKDKYHELDPIDIKGNGPTSLKPWILVGLAVAAYFVIKSKTL
jgi:hypothetical protein